jgi:hypothetical protein
MGEKTTTVALQKQANSLYKIQADKLSAVQNVFTKDQLQLLHQATPKQHIHHLPANAGAKSNLPFVTGGYMKHMLDRLTGGLWSFEIKEKGNTGGQIWVLGRLNLYKDGNVLIFKEQFGRAAIKYKKGTQDPLDIGNDMKAAATDALKKCASELGIARDIYAANEFIEAEIIDAGDVEDLSQPANGQPRDGGVQKEMEVDEDFKTYVMELLNELYPKTFDRTQYVGKTTGKISTSKMNDVEWRVLCTELETKKLEMASPDKEG